jgi:SepF-like predicted cell division protein (DUF552 family)
MNKFLPRYTIWQEIDDIKKRLNDLEKGGLVLEDTVELLNCEDLERDLQKLIDELRRLVRKHGKLRVNICSGDLP